MAYKQSQFLGCLAPNRPSYCLFDSPKCCFSCEHNETCQKIAIELKTMKPCTKDIFEEYEICEFSA